MNCAARRLSVRFRVKRCTVGFESPDEATSFLAPSGSYGEHGTLVASNHTVFAGAIGVQLTCTRPPYTTLANVLRSIASSNASRSFGLDASGVPAFEYGRLP